MDHSLVISLTSKPSHTSNHAIALSVTKNNNATSYLPSSIKLQSAPLSKREMEKENVCRKSLDLVDSNAPSCVSIDENDSKPSSESIRPALLFPEEQECLFEERGLADREDKNEDEETQRILMEQEESEALARLLMAEEAMASYSMSVNFLQSNSEIYSEADLAAFQAAMDEEDPYAEDAEEDGSMELSYEAMLQLGENLGDVKQERWIMTAKQQIEKLPLICSNTIKDQDGNDSFVKCLICQCQYEDDEVLRKLPCNHCFHAECVDHWLLKKDVCPYCRESIVQE